MTSETAKRDLQLDITGCKATLTQTVDKFVLSSWKDQLILTKQIINLLSTIMTKQKKLSGMK